jgi:hypothetical protein
MPAAEPSPRQGDAPSGQHASLPAQAIHQAREAPTKLQQRVIAPIYQCPEVVVKTVGMKCVPHDTNFWCVPSQRGGLAVCLHWHQRTVVGSAHSNFTG